MIHIENLGYSYPGSAEQVLQDIDLHICTGSLFGLLGPNGAGKTTLIGLLTGLLRVQSGSVTIQGFQLPQHAREIKRLIGYIPQDYAFYPNLTALENLQFFAGVQGLAGAHKAARIHDCLDFCQLQPVAKRRAGEYSGGLKRRLNIAIGLLADPEILIFDEPTVSIDPQSRAFILQQIHSLQQQGKTVIYTSHYMEEVEHLCDHLAIMDHGRVLTQGTLQEIRQGQERQLFVDCEQPVNPQVLQRLQAEFFVSLRDGQLVFRDIADLAALNAVIARIQATDLRVDRVFFGQQNLEQVFLGLTSKRLRD